MLEGRARVTALDTEGGNFIGEVEKGDLWYFPSGHPHSLQGLGKGGCEFLLIFDDGNFSEDSTFLLSDFMGIFPLSPRLYQINKMKSTHPSIRPQQKLPTLSRNLRPYSRKRKVHLRRLPPRPHGFRDAF